MITLTIQVMSILPDTPTNSMPPSSRIQMPSSEKLNAVYKKNMKNSWTIENKELHLL